MSGEHLLAWARYKRSSRDKSNMRRVASRDIHIVGDKEDSIPLLNMQGRQGLQERVFHAEVKIIGWLIQNQDCWASDQRTRNQNPLALPA
jgi:hypothetical protein